ncbi:MAG TPA: LptF/LptG family permease [Phycisphaerales bacterium]|nr:LptF/LptG family permease [Phycisphaerales bacterium]
MTPARLPLTIWRLVLSDLWRRVLLTTGVLVTVLAFAASVKFLADGRLGPVETLQFMALAVVPMLQYALPFGAGFGATLAYHRLAADNEVLACHAAGIGHRRVLAPALGSGMALAIGLGFLSSEIMPRYLRHMQDLVAQDATRLMVAAINRGEAVALEDTLVYADQVDRLGPDPASGAYERLRLWGVLAVKLDGKGGVEAEGSSREAIVWFFRRGEATGSLGWGEGSAGTQSGAAGDGAAGSGRSTLVVMRPKAFLFRRRGEASTESAQTELFFSMPDVLVDDPKFYRWGELRKLEERPELIPQIEAQRRWLATMLGERETIAALQAEVRSAGEMRLIDPMGDEVVVRGSALEWDYERKWYRIDAAGAEDEVEVTRAGGTGAPQRLRARRVYLRSLPRDEDWEQGLVLELRLEEVAAVVAGPGGRGEPVRTGELEERTLGGLVAAGNPTAEMMRRGPGELLGLADARVAAFTWDDAVRGPRDRLRKKIEDLRREIASKRHERLAMSAACLVMVVTGAVMAVRLREGLALHVYLWSFFPALGAVLTVSAGQQMVHEHGGIGLLLLWGGVAALGAYTLGQYRRLAAH